MPKQKDLKRVVRKRMEKTGESYTAARTRVLAKRARPDYAATAGMSDAAVRNKTGRTWSQWVEVLDRADAVSMPHREIAAMLHDTHGIPDWWAQMVTVGYERIRGLRVKGQRLDGTFDVNKSKTVAVPVERLYRAFANKPIRERWLPGAAVKTSTRDKSVRLRHVDGAPIEAYFTSKGSAKSQVQVQHRKLPGAAAAAAAKDDWAERLAVLAAMLTAKKNR